MTKSMQGPEPSDSELDAMLAFLGTLDFVPGRSVDAAAEKRGLAIFKAKGCDTCHAAPDYTSSGIYTVGLESEKDVYKGFNPPSLRGVGKRAPYLHEGQARFLSEVLTKYHRPSQLANKPDLTPDELKDILAFYNQQSAAYAGDKKSNAPSLALADVCQALLSLNEFLFVE